MKNPETKNTGFRLQSVLLAMFLAIGGGLTLTACDQGPAEEAGENMDDAMDDVGDSMEDAGDEVEDAVDRG